MEKPKPENTIRAVVDACTDCDVCRHLMDADCLFFPELYRLWDQEQASGEAISADALRRLVDLCNFCALCPCPNIRADIIEAKTQFIDRGGLKFGVRTIEDVERIGKICGTFPRLFNALLRNGPTGNLMKSAAGMHADRKFPEFPLTNFDRWAQKSRLNIKSNSVKKRKVAYFAGCTARFLFPDVPRAAVSVLQSVGVDVYVPEQKCCGMPSLLEGDRKLTLEFVGSNLRQLADAVRDGYDIVCSCPTCAYMLKAMVAAGTMERKLQHLLDGSEGEAVAWPVEESPLAYMQPQTKGALPVAKTDIGLRQLPLQSLLLQLLPAPDAAKEAPFIFDSSRFDDISACQRCFLECH